MDEHSERLITVMKVYAESAKSFTQFSSSVSLLQGPEMILNVTKLQERDGYRLTIEDWRVLYDLDDKRRTMDVLTVLKREEAYR